MCPSSGSKMKRNVVNKLTTSTYTSADTRANSDANSGHRGYLMTGPGGCWVGTTSPLGWVEQSLDE